MDEEKKNIIQLMLGFVRRANGDHVSAYATQAAYFLIMSRLGARSPRRDEQHSG